MTHPLPTDAGSLKELGQKLSNWGRWGSDDEIGTLNFVTPEVRVAAARMIVTGKVFDLGMPFGKRGPWDLPGVPRFNPIHLMSVVPADEMPYDQHTADDVIIMGLQSATQWDGLGHAGYAGRLYNDVPVSAVNTRNGATRVSFSAVIDRLISRGVLLDIPRLHGVQRLAESTDITAADLSAAAEMGGVEVRSGDIVLVRTGHYQHYLEGDHVGFMGREPGLGISTLEWLHTRQVAAVALDNWACEVLPSPLPDYPFPVHMVGIRDMGLTIGEMFDLEGLASDCAEDSVYEFFFSGTGLKIDNAVGSPVTPMAVK
jgi:kynurenine formamidase